jgi:hypothetical protein
MALTAPSMSFDRTADALAPLLLPEGLKLTADQFAAVCYAAAARSQLDPHQGIGRAIGPIEARFNSHWQSGGGTGS